MNTKDLLLPLGLALVTTWAIQYFFFGERSTNVAQDRSGQSFVAPEKAIEYKPLNREIDFVDEKRSGKAELTTIETPLANYVFSTDGACLYRFDDKRNIDGKIKTLTTIFPLADDEREHRCFMIGLQDKTPYFYQLLDRRDEGDVIVITYGSQSADADATITKKFIVSKDTYRITLEITVEPKNSTNIVPRIVFPSPITAELSRDTVNALTAGIQGAVQKKPVAKIISTDGWLEPAIFGTDDKYFVHALVEDPHHFAQRGYYTQTNDKLVSFVEGTGVSKKTTWTVSFYVGPKEEASLTAVNDRLEQALDYSGWLAPIAKIALALLKWLYSYLKNYGLAIIVLTILMKLVMVPFTWHAESGMKKRLEFQKKLQYVQQKYKNDPEQLAHERAELIKKHGMPGFSGCLPILIQIPLFFALNRVLASSIELYQAPFAFWISDLSATDPYYILPLLIVISMLLQATTAEPQQRFAVIAMALVFGAIASSLASGLCLYILVSTLLSVGQTSLARYFKAA